MPKVKRKSDTNIEDSPPPKKAQFGRTPKKPKEGKCIVHSHKLAKHGTFTTLSELKDAQGRFDYIHGIRITRQSQPIGSTKRLDTICQQIPTIFNENDGYHQNCYKSFVSHLPEKTNEEGGCRSPRKKKADNILFTKDCIFCNSHHNKNITIKGVRTKEPLQKFTKKGGLAIQPIAKGKKDEKLLRRIANHNLFSCEAWFHNSCRNKYTQKPEKWKSTDSEQKAHQYGLQEAHTTAFNKVVEHVKQTVIIERQVLRLSSLAMIYTSELSPTKFSNKDYRGDRKLMPKLEKNHELKDKIQFVKNTTDCVPFYLVYSKDISVQEAINNVYQLASKDSIKEVALTLRSLILRSYSVYKDMKENNTLPWPPSASDLKVEGVLPSKLDQFLSYIISDSESSKSDQACRLVLSIGQDICRAVTNGEWALPKHILLCMTLRHLFRSKQLITMINRLGHCENNSFASNLESAVDEALNTKSSLLTNQILKAPANVLFHSEWDNFNQNLTSVHGKSAINTAGGIMIQETIANTSSDTTTASASLPTVPRRVRRSSTVPPLALAPFNIAKRSGPKMLDYTSEPPAENSVAHKKGLNIYTIWLLCRYACAAGRQKVPAFGGFVSATGNPPSKLSTIDYYPWIPEPITQYNVVKSLLKKSEQATEEVGQNYTITTFDLGVCMKALPIIWDNPDDYQNHIILIGAFHVIMNYLNMLGHKMGGSGYAELLSEANLVTSGCLKRVLSGKSYEKAMWCLKVVSECLERKLLNVFIEKNPNMNSYPSALQELIKLTNLEKLHAAEKDASLIDYIQKYTEFQVLIKLNAMR